MDKEILIWEKGDSLSVSGLEWFRSVKPLLIAQSLTALEGLAGRATNQSLLQNAPKSGKKQSSAGERKEMDAPRTKGSSIESTDRVVRTVKLQTKALRCIWRMSHEGLAVMPS